MDHFIRLLEDSHDAVCSVGMQFNTTPPDKPPTPKQIERVRGMTWEQIAKALYQMLDDIDTASDMCKENLQAFQDMVLKKQQEKNLYLISPDGYGLKRVGESKLKEGLVDHSRRELKLAGLFDKDSDYDGMLGDAVMELMEVFAKQGHSGFSAALTRELFSKLADWKNLTELTDNTDEWNDVSEMGGGTEKPLWQSGRSPDCFSLDGGKTYYSIDDSIFKYTDENGDTWNQSNVEDWKEKVTWHKSKQAA